MIRPISLKALSDHRTWIVFFDGAEGAVDLSDLAGRGVSGAWNGKAFFAGVHLGPARQIWWSE